MACGRNWHSTNESLLFLFSRFIGCKCSKLAGNSNLHIFLQFILDNDADKVSPTTLYIYIYCFFIICKRSCIVPALFVYFIAVGVGQLRMQSTRRINKPHKQLPVMLLSRGIWTELLFQEKSNWTFYQFALSCNGGNGFNEYVQWVAIEGDSWVIIRDPLMFYSREYNPTTHTTPR